MEQYCTCFSNCVTMLCDRNCTTEKVKVEQKTYPLSALVLRCRLEIKKEEASLFSWASDHKLSPFCCFKFYLNA